MTTAQISNSNIVGLVATLFVRLLVGPLCDKFGPRYVMAGILIAGAIPTAAVPGVTSVGGLYAIRFFVGILGGTFVPTVVWTTQFFDKSIVGRANALAGGWGNAGGGITFFVMPAVVKSLMEHQGYDNHHAWRLAFPACPLAILLGMAVMLLLFGHDTPTGPWRTRHLHAVGKIVDAEALDRQFSGEKGMDVGSSSQRSTGSTSPKAEKIGAVDPQTDMAVGTVDTVVDETPVDPKLVQVFKVMMHPQTICLAMSYVCSFGSELAIEGVLSAIYIQSAKLHDKQTWGQELAGQWAAMFGLLNIVTRPLGGNLLCLDWVCAKHEGPLSDWSHGWSCYLLEAANGAVFSLVPHVFPKNNGIVSGFVGAAGNSGGIFFGLAFRFNGTDYHKALWIIGVVILAIQAAVFWVPMPKH
ncbi:hypothetical protein MRB53_040515 [Persea americana]|nr:hypothetical protein MRB53_040515 [Persea americana]